MRIIKFLLIAVALYAASRTVSSPQPPTTDNWLRSNANPLFGGSVAAAAQEPNVMIEGGIFKMWYTESAGAATPHLSYATSTDGIHWTQYSGNPALGNGGSGYSGRAEHTSVIKIGSTYYCYFANDNNGDLLLSTSTNGTSWSTPTIVIPQHDQAWSQGWNNSYVWQEGGTWHMLVEGMNGGNLFLITLATSSDGLSWTFDSHHFLPSLQPRGNGTTGGPWLEKLGSIYHLWYHGSSNGDNTPTDIYHATSTDLVNWTIQNNGNPIITHSGSGDEIDQVADPAIVVLNGQSYMYFEGVHNGTSTFKMELALGQ